MEIDGWATARRITGAVLFMLALAAFYAGVAQAEPRIKVSGCDVYATNQVDPIAGSDHVHHQFGNTTTTNTSTGRSARRRGRTSLLRSLATVRMRHGNAIRSVPQAKVYQPLV